MHFPRRIAVVQICVTRKLMERRFNCRREWRGGGRRRDTSRHETVSA